jgi:hypothetical protein
VTAEPPLFPLSPRQKYHFSPADPELKPVNPEPVVDELLATNTISRTLVDPFCICNFILLPFLPSTQSRIQ